MSSTERLLFRMRRLAPVLVLLLAAALRLWALARPGSLVFDELYYVRDAISQLAHGYPTTWPNDDPALTSANARAFTDAASNAVHPPLGKWLIGLGVLLFGPDNGWGWRLSAAIAGVATVGVTMRLAWRMSRSVAIACIAGLLLALDGVHVVLSRVSLLDGFLALAIVLGALFMWRDHEQTGRVLRESALSGARFAPLVWRRPWLLAAGLAFGAAAGIKWSGLYPLAAFLVLVVVQDLLRRLRLGAKTPLLDALAQAFITGLIALPAAAIAYLATWIGWIVTPGGWDRTPKGSWWADLLRYHSDMLAWHGSLSAPHPYASHPITWPLDLRPTAMYLQQIPQGASCPWAGGCVSVVSPLPNIVVTWGGVLALLVLIWLVLRTAIGVGSPVRAAGRLAARAARARPAAEPSFAPPAPRHRVSRSLVASPLMPAAAFVLVGYASGWLPWLLTVKRSAVFEFYAVVLTPFSAIGLALVLGMLWGIPIRSERASARGMRIDGSRESLLGRRLTVALVLGFAVALGAFFFPVWSGIPMSEWFWQAHRWLPGWD